MFQRISDFVAEKCGSPWFIVFHICIWTVWFFIEPYPFLFLTLVVSLEAILLSGLILNSTNRQGQLDRDKAQDDFDIDYETLMIVEQILAMIKEGKTSLEKKEKLDE